MVLGEGRAEGGGGDIRRLNRDRVTVAERDLDAEALERLEEFAKRHRLIRPA
jgi:hypothetical protein